MLKELITVKVCLYCTLFSSKFTLTAYFLVESVVIYTFAFDIVHIPQEEVNDVSASRALGRQ
jgi:hypothetical protein